MSSTQLGNLYRRFVRGTDIKEPVTVQIQDVREVEVQPHPSIPPRKKWCLIVAGLSEDLPNGILFGPENEGRLFDIFGPVDIQALRDKHLRLVPKRVKVGRNWKMSITFEAAPAGSQAKTAPAPQAPPPPPPPPAPPEPDDIPF